MSINTHGRFTNIYINKCQNIKPNNIYIVYLHCRCTDMPDEPGCGICVVRTAELDCNMSQVIPSPRHNIYDIISCVTFN